MNRESLEFYAHSKGLNNSDLARMADVSRQRVSQWFKNRNEFINVGTENLLGLCTGMELSPNKLMFPIPRLEDLKSNETLLLWDHLYPTIGAFHGALTRWELPAVARLVETFGLFEAEKILGKKIWKKFHDYSRFIHPIRRKELSYVVEEVLSNQT